MPHRTRRDRRPAGIMDSVPRNFHLERYPGKYVAVDLATDEIMLTADTPQELHDEIQARGLRNVATMRAPTEDEPLFVGPG